MQSTSNQFKTAVKSSGRHFKSYVMINGAKYESIDGMEIKYGIIQGDDIGIGNCYISSLSITLKGVTTAPNFLGQKIIPYIGLQLDDTGTNFEYLKMGVFKAQTANVVDRSIVITANDNMQLANVGFFSNLKGNQKITAIMNEQCQKLGISFVGGADDVAIDVSKLEGLKIIEAMSLMSAYCGKNAIANREGNIEFKWFNDIAYEIGPNRYPSPLTVGEKDFVVNGVSCVVDKDTTLSSGLTTGKVISISNQFMTQARLDTIFNKMKSFTYRTCNLTYTMCDPSLEVGDIVTIKDVKGNKYKVPLFNFSVKFTGGCAGAIECFGKTDEQKSNQNGGFLSKKVERNYTEYISTKELLADTIVAYDGKFGKVETDYLQVNVEISALSGKFGTISSDLANFKVTNTEQLNAINAKINTLETVDLKAITATIAQANIDIGKINTLLAGTVTAGSGQYININAKNALFDNAFFKQLVATNVTAVDIFGERISTNEFKVGSDDGRLSIVDNTIQIKDANRQRVQIGKDASGDYNIYVWDKLGKLMFDATGITADGIQKPIIRDDMVSANANISGDKLNITSVITKINANSTLIESSHVKYDGKSLDVAFNNLQTTVDGIQIGGRNLLRFTGDLRKGSATSPDSATGINIWTGAKGTLTDTTEGLKLTRNGSANDSFWIPIASLGCVENGELVTLSFKYRTNTTNTGSFYFIQSSGANISIPMPALTVSETEWKEFKWTFSNAQANIRLFKSVLLFYGPSATGQWIEIKKRTLKLEKGNKPSDWTSALEDTDGQIATLTESIKSQSTQISVAQGQIGTLITDVSQSKSDIATVKGGLTTATGNISTLQSNYSTLNQTVSGLGATVGSHTSSITTLTGTANTALTNANNANTKIDNLQIGTRNLLENSSMKQNLDGWTALAGGGGTIVAEDGYNCLKVVGAIGVTKYVGKRVETKLNPNLNTHYTISAWIKTVDHVAGATNPACYAFYFTGYDTDGVWIGATTISMSADFKSSNNKGWTYIHSTFKFNKQIKSMHYMIHIRDATGTFFIRDICMVEGDKPIPYIPAPEDVDERITTEIKTVTDKQTSFDVLLTGITGRVSATESTVTTVTNTVNNNKANWDKAPTALANANNAQTTANTANTQANTNKSNIANLTTTVTETKSTLATLKLDYEGFKTNVSSTYTTKTEFNNLQIGGRNLLLKSGSTLTNNNYLIGYYKLGDTKPKEGDQCTITIKGSLGTGKTYFRLYNTGGSVPMAEIYPIEFIDGIASKPFIWRIKNNGNTASNTELHVYAMPNTVTGVTSTIEWIRLDFGNKAPRIWTPAPEDIENSITSISDKQTTFEATLNGITGRVSSVETVTKVVTDNKVNWDKAPTALSTANTANTLANANKTNLANLTTTVTETKSTLATLKLDYEGFRTDVSETYTTKTEFDNLQIGGRNLLKYTDFTTLKTDYWTTGLKSYTPNIADPLGTKKAIRLAVKEANSYLLVSGAKQSFPEPKEYTVSVWMRANKTGKVRMSIGEDAADSTKSVYNDVTTAWKQYSLTVKVTKTTPVYSFIIGGWSSWTDLTLEVDVAFPMLIAGNKPMDWSPSPDDIDASIATVDGKFVNYSTTTQMNSAIDQTKNAITQTVSNNYKELKGDNTLSHALSMIATGKLVHQDPTFMINANMVSYYNLTGALARVVKPADCPTSSTHCIEIRATGASTVATTGVGGFYQRIDSRANAVFVIKYLIKLPVGYKLMTATNSMGTGYTDKFLTPTEGTGKWEEYVRMVECGATGTFSTGGHIWVSGSPTPTASAPLVWYLGAIYQYDVTDSPDMYSRLKTAESKLTEDAMIVTISTAINGGKKLDTTKFTMDALGLHIKGGGFDISNNAGTKVLSADVSGNLVLNNITANNGTFNGTINATSGSIGDFVIMSGAITSGYTTSGGRLENYLTLNKTMFEVVLTGVGNARCAYNYIGVTATSTNSSKTTWMDGNQIFTNGSITAEEYNTVRGNEIIFNTGTYKTLWFGYRAGSSGTKISEWYFGNGTNGGKGTILCGALNCSGGLNTQGSSAWLGNFYTPGGASQWFGFYNAYNGTRKGWIGHDGGNNFNFRNDTSGSFDFNKWIYAPAFYDLGTDGRCTASPNITRFKDFSDYLEIAGGNWAKGIYYTVSDIKFKKDVMPTGVNNAMDIINQLEHVQFNWIDGGKHVDIGYIANDVKDIMEGLTFNVKQPDGSDQYNINQTTFLPLLTKGMQELSKTLDTHDDRLTELEKENESLKLALSKEIQLRIDLEGRFNQLRTTI